MPGGIQPADTRAPKAQSKRRQNLTFWRQECIEQRLERDYENEIPGWYVAGGKFLVRSPARLNWHRDRTPLFRSSSRGRMPYPLYAPPYPGYGYTWVDGYWYQAGPRRLWRGGYWAPPVYGRAYYGRGYRIAPRYNSYRYSYGRGRR
jgi:hypothetical protein